MSFVENLEQGQIGEGEIARWFQGRGYSVLPAYEIELGHGKGPRLYTSEGKFISPDMLVFNSDKVLWIEAKTKTAFTWHRISSTWNTGIDRRHWNHYLEVNRITPFPVWLLFLHRPNGTAKDTPEGLVSPSGLFGNEIGFLKDHIHHEHENHGPTGMVYWAVESLKLIEGYLSFKNKIINLRRSSN
jgi:hypothetical protein